MIRKHKQERNFYELIHPGHKWSKTERAKMIRLNRGVARIKRGK